MQNFKSTSIDYQCNSLNIVRNTPKINFNSLAMKEYQKEYKTCSATSQTIFNHKFILYAVYCYFIQKLLLNSVVRNLVSVATKLGSTFI